MGETVYKDTIISTNVYKEDDIYLLRKIIEYPGEGIRVSVRVRAELGLGIGGESE